MYIANALTIPNIPNAIKISTTVITQWALSLNQVKPLIFPLDEPNNSDKEINTSITDTIIKPINIAIEVFSGFSISDCIPAEV